MPITSTWDRPATRGPGLSSSVTAFLPSSGGIAAPPGVRDSTLTGMVAKGHGIEALCLFLDLLEVDLLARVVALNLYTPHNGAVRRTSGVRNAWQIGEIRQLIALWELNLSSQCISEKLGRSQGSIRAKARWLGLLRRPRGSIVHDYAEVPVKPATAKPAKTKRTRWDNDLSMQVIERILAYQHYVAVARDLNLTPAQVRSKIKVLGLPKNRDRKLLTMDYRPDSPEAKALRATHTIKYCKNWGRVFVVQPGDTFSTCPAYRGTKERKYMTDMYG